MANDLDLEVQSKKKVVEVWWIGICTDAKISVSDWADKHRILSSVSSAEPGPWRTDRTPYLKEIMDCFTPSNHIEEIVVQKGAQIGYTEALVNVIGFIIDVTSGPSLVVQPTVDLAKRFSKQRIDPLIEFSERMQMKVSEARSRDSGNTVLSKEFPGGILILTGANSAVGLRSVPVRVLLLDEIDAYPDDADGEGDPLLLARARTRTFARRKIAMGSTPTIDARSKIARAFKDSDMRYYYVPCPHCQFMQTIMWEKIKWPKGEPDAAYMECESCKKHIREQHKTDMLAAGKWIPTNPDVYNKKVAGFHISSLYSPVGWYSWAEAANEFLKAKDTPERLRGFVNTVLGETWKEKGDAPDWKRLYERRENYEMAKIPAGGYFLTAGADVQKDRIEVEIVTWGPGKESWSVDYRVFFGDTSSTESAAWLGLDSLLEESFPHECGLSLHIQLMAVDSGFNTQVVYNWCRKYPMNRVIATKGSDTSAVMVGAPSAVDVTVRGQRLKKGFRVWPIGVGIAKTELYGWLKQEKPADGGIFPPGYCHFPQYGEQFFKQITAEQLVIRIIRGYSRYIWEKIADRNEALDCRILARVAAQVVGMDRYKQEHWDALGMPIKKKQAQNEPTSTENSTKTTQVASNEDQSPTLRRRKSSFWD